MPVSSKPYKTITTSEDYEEMLDDIDECIIYMKTN